MKKIKIIIKDNNLLFSTLYQSTIENEKIMNTNIIKDNELIFSDNYLINNGEIVSLFIEDLIKSQNITGIVITKLDIIKILENILINLKCKLDLYISDEKSLSYEVYEIISKANIFDKVNCYTIPSYLLELFDRRGIEVISRAEILYTSNFMEENNLISYSKIYYKNAIKLNPPLTSLDLGDFNSFLKVNKYLKVIHFNAVSIQSLDEIVDIIIKNKRKKIKIIIHDNITSKELITELKKRKKKYLQYNIDLCLEYTLEYVENNYGKQLIVTVIAMCALVTLIILGGTTTYVILNNKESEKNIAVINEEIAAKLNELNEETTADETYIPTEVDDVGISSKMAKLKELNNDTAGWLEVPGTNINYPVVRGSDNSFYLNHNFKKEYDYNGWVFMHYKNNIDALDQNTIIFAHNRYYSGVMFGTLSNVTKKNWYQNAKDIRITFNTLKEDLEWEVFSIYPIDVTDDYIRTNFDTEKEWFDFIDMIQKRSIFKSDVKIGKDDKIISLSTCLDNDRRLVVHAVLRKN